MHSKFIYFMLFSALMVCLTFAKLKSTREFEIKQGLFSGGRSYTIKTLSCRDCQNFKIENEWFSIGKKLSLLEGGKVKYQIKHDLGLKLFQEWKIYNAQGEVIGTLKHKAHLGNDKYTVKLGDQKYTVSGNFITRTFRIKKNGVKTVAKIYKKLFHLHDIYTVKVNQSEDPALMLLIAIGVDEIRQH